jgi:hypothetical protein
MNSKIYELIFQETLHDRIITHLRIRAILFYLLRQYNEFIFPISWTLPCPLLDDDYSPTRWARKKQKQIIYDAIFEKTDIARARHFISMILSHMWRPQRHTACRRFIS